MSAFVYSEDRLAQALGLPEKLLQKTRGKKLAHGADWDLNTGRVAYSKPGAIAVLFVLAPDKWQGLALETLLEKCRLRQPGDDLVQQATVVKVWPNPHLVDLDLNGQRIRVRVKTTDNLRVGMQLKVRPIDDGTAGYELAQRLPRSVREGRRAMP